MGAVRRCPPPAEFARLFEALACRLRPTRAQSSADLRATRKGVFAKLLHVQSGSFSLILPPGSGDVLAQSLHECTGSFEDNFCWTVARARRQKVPGRIRKACIGRMHARGVAKDAGL